MFKKVSDNTQSRINRATEFSTKNDAGLDPAAFGAHPQTRHSASMDDLHTARRVLIDRKQELEQLLHSRKAVVHRAHMKMRYGLQTALASQMYQKAIQDRDDTIARLFQTEKELRANGRAISEQRRAGRANRNDRRETFAETFHEIAKELLAGPVIARLTAATIHRIGERKDEKNESTGQHHEPPPRPLDARPGAAAARDLPAHAPGR